jgi:uncharacterized protein YjbJ (UPF0337 family)
MNQDIFEGKWKQAKGNIRQWWGDLTDDDVEKIKGNRDELVGKLQERYGWTRDKAEREINERFDEFEGSTR